MQARAATHNKRIAPFQPQDIFATVRVPFDSVGWGDGAQHDHSTRGRNTMAKLSRFRIWFTILIGLAVGLCSTGASLAQEKALPPTVVVVEGERFTPLDDKGWAVKHQDETYASHAYGGMWVTFGGLLGAPADSVGSVAVQKITVPEDGQYRVWSKYQSPPYFNFIHKVEVHQGGKKVFEHTYGKVTAKRLYTFSGHPYNMPAMSQVWFPWGVDHDGAEAPAAPVALKAGDAEIRLITVKNEDPAGDRYVDFIVLTTEMADMFEGKFRNGQSKSPFMFEAMHAAPIYLRFKNVGKQPIHVSLNALFGHFTWHCAPKRGVLPPLPPKPAKGQPAAEPEKIQPGQWSPWYKISHIVELVSDEGLSVTAVTQVGAGRNDPGQAALDIRELPVQIALDPQGKDIRADLLVPQVRYQSTSIDRNTKESKTSTHHAGEAIHFPLDFMWNTDSPTAKIRLSQDISADIIKATKTTWRKSSPTKPRHIAFFGSFDRGGKPWAITLKDALGYNTQFPDNTNYEKLPVDGYYQHMASEAQFKKYAEAQGAEKIKQFRVCSFGDEITIRMPNFANAEVAGQHLEPFRAWLKQKGVTAKDLGGVNPAAATLTGSPRIDWWARLYGAETAFAKYRNLTASAKQVFGPQVETGANYSPHHGVAYYGDQLQWIDAFKHNAMSMFWSEDYIFSMAEPPQIFSFLFARAHCAVKYNNQLIHMYVMAHAPGQTHENLRRNMVYAIGAGAKHIDSFWVGPQENYSENFTSWQYLDSFRVLFESIHDTARVEPFLEGSTRRKARVAVVTGKATDINEHRTRVDASLDPFTAMAENKGQFRQGVEQTICRKDQQSIYLSLRHTQRMVDLITEDDIVEDDVLKQYDVVYFAGEWVNDKAVPKLDAWVRQGGTLYASTGLGWRNQYNEVESSLLDLLGIKVVGEPAKNLYHIRPYLELPLTKPIDTITFEGKQINAVAMKQVLAPTTAKTIGTWSDGKPAVTVRELGKGKAYAIGTAIGNTHLKTAVRPVPWARGGYVNLYNPTDYDATTTKLIGLGVADMTAPREVQCSDPFVESQLLDNKKGTLVTLVNWTNEPSRDVTVKVRLAKKPARIHAVELDKDLPFEFADGVATFAVRVNEADFIEVHN